MTALFSAILAMLTMMSLAGTAAQPATDYTTLNPDTMQPASIEVDPTAYATADWPTHNNGRLNARNVQGQKLAVQLGNETWLTKKKDLNGKVLVLDFWAVWCPPCRAAEPKFHALQQSNTGSLEVVAISGQNESQSTVEEYLAKKSDLNYTHLYDAEQGIYRSLQVRAIPHVVVLSTDGVVRWQGNPHEKAFQKAVEQVIANDPLIAAKQAAEDAG